MHHEVEQMFDLAGRVAMVTGGARNLGYDAACVLAAAGTDLIITSRDKAHAEATAGKLRESYGVDVLPLGMDQTEFDQVGDATAAAIGWKDRVDVLVNNAGGGSGKSTGFLFERDPADIEHLIRLNLTGVAWCCREVGRHMADRKSGKIINIASMAAMVGRDRKMYDRNDMTGQPVDYAAAKAGVIGLTQDLAALMAPTAQRVRKVPPERKVTREPVPGWTGPVRSPRTSASSSTTCSMWTMSMRTLSMRTSFSGNSQWTPWGMVTACTGYP